MNDVLCASDRIIIGCEKLETNFITINPITSIKPIVVNRKVFASS